MATATTVMTTLVHVAIEDLPSSPDIAQLPSDRLYKPSTWIARMLKQQAWNEMDDPLSFDGALALPMPVAVSDKESLAPFFAHLRNGGTVEAVDGAMAGVEPHYDTELVEFRKGVLYIDGRVDLCKMVTGPRNIGDLMDSLKPNTFAKHFLLGNNIIGSTGANAIADFLGKYPNRMETWYLAGNCIDTASFSILVDAMIMSPVITNLWLKRNPLRPAAAPDIFRLITRSPVLRTLDLDLTELGDVGVAELFSSLADHDQAIALRHIYLNGCGIGSAACEQISRYLSSSNCKLVSLYMSCNPVGDAVSSLSPGLARTTTLKRLSLQSCGLKDEGTIPLLEAITGHPSIKVLDIGQAYATQDLGMRFNWLACAETLINLIKHTKLEYLNISYHPIAQIDLNSVLRTVIESESLLWFFAPPLVKGGRTHAEIKAGQEATRLNKAVRERLHHNVANLHHGISYQAFEAQHKRFLISPEDVRLIDSVYRNRDAGLARRGLKHLNKWWDEGDETLQHVQNGAVE